MSIVIAVYDDKNVLKKTLDSIVSQTVDHSLFEVLLVDGVADDSTDLIYGEYLDLYPDLFRVCKIDNKGYIPVAYNIGIGEAQGEFVFLCGSGDYFGREAFERMLSHADEWNSDVMLVKFGESERENIPRSMFEETVPNASLFESRIERTLGIRKLFRRALLLENDIWLPEDRSPENPIFVIRAYLAAQVISIASDYDYYFWTLRDFPSKRKKLEETSEGPFQKEGPRLGALQTLFSLLDGFEDRELASGFYKKILEHYLYDTLVEALKKERSAQAVDIIALREMAIPYCTDYVMKKIAFKQRISLTCLMNHDEPDVICEAVKQGKAGVKSFDLKGGKFQCKHSMMLELNCLCCDEAVQKRYQSNIATRYFSNSIGSVVVKAVKLPGLKQAAKPIGRFLAKNVGRLRSLKGKIKKKIRDGLNDYLLSRRFPRLYQKAINRSDVDSKKVLLIEPQAMAMTDAFKTLYSKLSSEYDFDVEVFYLQAHHVSVKKYYENAVVFLNKLALAKYAFINEGSRITGCISLRKETQLVQLWHGCGAFKRFGFSTADLLFGGSAEDQLKHPLYTNYSLVTVSSPEVVWAYEEAMLLENRRIVEPIGVSRTDVFFDYDFREAAVVKVEQEIPQCVGKKTILYAPTFRGRVKSAKAPNGLNIRAFKEALGEDYILLIKHHPHIANPPEIPKDCSEFAFQIGAELSTDILICAADICISDYSSLIFEFSLFERPMIFFAYDIQEYNDWRGFYYDYDVLTPGPVFRNNEEMLDYILNIDAKFDKQQIRNFKEKFMRSCDGYSTDRIIERVFKEDAQKHKKPVVTKRFVEEDPVGKDISIIIAVYNGIPDINRAIQSALFQTYDRSRMEIVIADNCSADGTWEVLQDYATRYPDLFVIKRHEVNSGTPGKSRNTGRDLSTGKYIFYLDADDWLAPRAVEKMLKHAEEWDSDILYVKMRGVGRSQPTSMFTHNQPKVDVFSSKVTRSLGPWKLFRRAMLEENGIRCAEVGMPEDMPFVIRALCAAETVSVASDYYYYNIFLREDTTTHVTHNLFKDLNRNLLIYEPIFDFIGKNISQEDRNKVLMSRMFASVESMFVSLIKNYEGDEREKYFSRIVDMVKPFYDEDAYNKLACDTRFILDAAINGDIGFLNSVVTRGARAYVKNSVFYENEGQILTQIKSDSRELSIDVTSNAGFIHYITGFESIGDSGFQIEGTLEPSIPLKINISDLRIDLVLKNDRGIEELITECELASDSEAAKSTFDNGVTWRSVIDFDRLWEAGEDPSECDWFFFLRFSWGEFKRDIRLGKRCDNTAKAQFSLLKKERQNIVYKSRLTRFGNFCIKSEASIEAQEKKVLLVVASGKSTRFGGLPKAFCDVGGRSNVENTIALSKELYDQIYIVVNEETLSTTSAAIEGAELFSIVTGQGDADSMRKALNVITKKEPGVKYVTVCWGDAVFVDSLPFEHAIATYVQNIEKPILAACAVDENPYAWFDVEGNDIYASHFSSNEGMVLEGLHDQSLFVVNVAMFLRQIGEYRSFLGLPNNDSIYNADLPEMRLLDSFEFFCINESMSPAGYFVIPQDKVLAFNTVEELDIIRKQLFVFQK